MKNKEHIWLVDDDKISLMSMTRAFSRLNVDYPLVSFSEPDDALACLLASKTKMPGIILLDIKMQKISGIQFLQVVKNHPELKKIPVIILTTSDSPQDILDCFELQIAGYFIKPLDFFEIAGVLVNYWGRGELASID